MKAIYLYNLAYPQTTNKEVFGYPLNEYFWNLRLKYQN